MDDFRDDPEKVSEDIVKQAGPLGFREDAKKRIMQILIAYHALKAKLELTSSVKFDGLCYVLGNRKLCPRCWKKEGINADVTEKEEGSYRCQVCGWCAATAEHDAKTLEKYRGLQREHRRP
jgi:hypothetical protein